MSILAQTKFKESLPVRLGDAHEEVHSGTKRS